MFRGEEGVAGSDTVKGCAQIRLAFAEVEGFQAGGDVSLMLFGAGVLEQKLSALARFGFPISALGCNLTHVVPQSFAEGRVR